MRRTTSYVVVLAAALALLPATAASAATWAGQSPVDPVGSTASGLSGTTCTSSTNCLAAGTYDPGTGITLPLIEKWNGTAWSQLTAATPPAGHNGAALVSVGCSSSTACTAVGNYYDANFDQWALVQRYNGTAWASQTFFRPAGALGTSLSSVVCPSSTSCYAVGTYIDASGVSQPLSASWNGTTWSQLTVPTVAGSTGTGLSAIACTSTTVCTTVGSYLDARGTPLPTSATLASGTWTLKTVATPTGAAATFLSGLSCTSSSACTTVGYATDSLGAVFAVAERFNGTTWAQQTLASPPAGSTGSALIGVSCTTSTHCSAVGYYLDASSVQNTFGQGWNGTTWSLQSTPNPAGSTGGAVNGISCTSSTICESVGYFYDSSSVQRTLAQRFS